nr:uncharacterized protein LOC109157428 [Ipomoea batatas]
MPMSHATLWPREVMMSHQLDLDHFIPTNLAILITYAAGYEKWWLPLNDFGWTTATWMPLVHTCKRMRPCRRTTKSNKLIMPRPRRMPSRTGREPRTLLVLQMSEIPHAYPKYSSYSCLPQIAQEWVLNPRGKAALGPVAEVWLREMDEGHARIMRSCLLHEATRDARPFVREVASSIAS